MKISFTLLPLLVICCLSCLVKEQNIPMEKGVSKQLADFRAEMISDLSYNLNFSLPTNKEDAIVATVYMKFQLENNDQPIQLDFRADSSQIQRVTINGGEAAVNFENDHILLPNDRLFAGANVVLISFIAGDLSLNRKDDFLYTLLVPDRAATLFPCFDQPNLKAEFILQLDVPTEWTALANGSVLLDTIHEDRRYLEFKKTAPISTYLFAFTAGVFQEKTATVGGREMRMLYRESDQEKVSRNEATIFKLHLDAIEWMERYTDIPLPFEKFDFALIPGFQYGGMEHVGAIFYRESSLMLDENATENQLLSRASLIAHETTHMWFGDLVTMSWFDDVWLKEVFANFMAAKIVNPAFPEVNHELNFLLRHQPAAYGEDRSQGSHPIQQKLDNLNEAGTLYGRIIYQKAPVVMRQLENKTGAQQLRDGLRAYLRHFAYSNASWDDLIAILDKRTEEDLQQWSKVWVKSARMPVFQANWDKGEGKKGIYMLHYSQPKQESGYWSESTEVAIFYTDSVWRIPYELVAGEVSPTIELTVDEPLAVLPNASPMSYGYFPLDEKSQQYFLQHISEVDDPLLRGAAWLALYEDFLNKKLDLGSFFLTVLDAIPQEENQLNRSYLLRTLETLYWQFFTAAERLQYGLEVEKMLREAYLNAATGGEQIAFFRTYYKTALSDAAMDELLQIWETQQIAPGLPLTESEAIDLVAELTLRKPKEGAEWLKKQYERTENKDRKERLEFITGSLLYNHSARLAFFEGFKELENRGTEPWVVDAAGYLNHPLHYPHSIEYLLPSLELMAEIQATGDIFFPRQFITATLSGHQSAEAAQIVENFLATRPDYPARLKNKILMAADLLFRTRYPR